MCLGVPGRITDLRDDRGTLMGTIDFGGIGKEVCLAYLPDAQPGDWALVHAGFAITLLDEASALETLDLLRQLGTLQAELGMADPDPAPDAAPTQAPGPTP